jgi:lipopolysaccharide/colanic/teichoic acid biosynthesis glycosyltransferase
MLYNVTKRALDIICATLGLIFLSPVIIAIAIWIKLDSKGPVFADTPMRVCKDGKLFKMYKFRSMVQGAWEILQKNPELLKKYKENSYKLDINEDPRITKVGKFIRKTSIDELPQLINILKGQMSVVGPRAYYPFELEEQQKKYPETRDAVKVILKAKPGLTGLWQVSGRSDINFDKRVELDEEYVKKHSIVYDLLIILKTVPAVLSGKGAV